MYAKKNLIKKRNFIHFFEDYILNYIKREEMSGVSRKLALYDKLHRLGVISMLGVAGVTAVLLGYNVMLFRQGTPFPPLTHKIKLILQLVSFLHC